MINNALVILCLLKSFLGGVPIETDNLEEIYPDQEGATRIDSLLEMAGSYITTSPDSIRKYAELALHEAQELSAVEGEAKAWTLLGTSYRLIQNYDSAEIAYKKANTLTRDEETKANSLMGLGGVAYADSRLDRALEYFIEATVIFEKIEKEDRLAAGYTNIGLILNATDNDEKALEYFRKSIMLSRRGDNYNALLPALVNISTLFLKREMYDSAISYAQECYDLSKESDLVYGMAKALTILSQAHISTGQPQKGLADATEAKKLFQSMRIDRSVLMMMRYEARALEKLKRYAEAIQIGLELEKRKDDLPGNELEHLYLLLSELYEAKRNSSKALHYHKLYLDEYKNFVTREKDEFVNDLEAKYETEKKGLQIAGLTRENELQALKNRQQLTIFIGGSVLLILLVMIIFLYYRQKLTIQKEKTSLHKQQLLRSQMNPHFIFNALTSIRGYLFDKNDLKEAVNYLGKFAKLMRLVLDHSSREWVTLEEELEALKIYLEIQKMRFNQGFSYEVKVDPDIPLKNIKVPPLLAQPFVENAIEHGFKNISYEGKVEFTCKSDGDLIRFSIMDNGIGIDHVTKRSEHESRALRIFKQRLDLLGKRLKVNLTYLIKDLGSAGQTGTLVEFALPRQSHV